MCGNAKTGLQKLWYDLSVCIQQINALNTKIAILDVMLQEDTCRVYEMCTRAAP